MNEVSKIHLGRQAFTISVEAHHDLKAYLAAIKKQVGDNDVVEEVELRMAELLGEHGVSGEKVILPADIDFLKQQLGDPKDFTEAEDEPAATADKQSDNKRLFRDTENAMLAGVAAGLSKYTGIDVLLIRILFVIGAFTGGWGIVLYLVLWLLAPEAKTSSDRLQMVGVPVTVNSLREVVERADVKSAARRANDSLVRPLNHAFRFLLNLIGLGFIVTGLCAIFGLIAAGSYILLQKDVLFQGSVFPIGLREHLLVDVSMAVLALLAVFVVLLGIAIFRRKWPIRTWVTGVLVGLVFLGLAGGGALAADVVPTVRDRYNDQFHTTVRAVRPFNQVNFAGDDVNVNYQASSSYSVSLRYYDHPDLTGIKTNVVGGVLQIDTQNFDWHRHCHTLCIPNTYDIAVTVSSPNPPQFPDQPDQPKPPLPPSVSPEPIQ